MTEYLTEQEQIEILKGWIKQYSLVVLSGILFAAIIIAGWRYWQERHTRILDHASAVYDEMLAMRSQNNNEATIVQAKKLYKHYPQTIYGNMAAMMLAKEAISKKEYQIASQYLQWVLNHSGVATFKQIARIRLARVLLAEKKPKESIQSLETVDDASFNGLIAEVKGDAYLTLQDKVMARQSYRQALAELPNAEIIRPLLQMKYDNLAAAK